MKVLDHCPVCDSSDKARNGPDVPSNVPSCMDPWHYPYNSMFRANENGTGFILDPVALDEDDFRREIIRTYNTGKRHRDSYTDIGWKRREFLDLVVSVLRDKGVLK